VDIGAFRTSRRNLVDSAGQGIVVDVAEMSAAGFRVARIQPFRGRALVDADERPNAPPVIVIGHDVWRERFQGDPHIIGRVVRLGRVAHVIVGVMPQGFAFPVNDAYWIPLRADPAAYPEGEGPRLNVFARLAPGATREGAQAELTVIGQHTAAATTPNEPDERLTPRVMDYVEVFADTGATPATLVLLQTGFAMLLVLVCLNVAVLVYARTIVRTGEIAVRTALGATRGRIVTQLGAEALVLSLLSASAGLVLVSAGLRTVDHILETYEGGLPFWVHRGLSLGTVLYTLGLAFLAAIVVGIVPALRATRGQLHATLSALSGGGKPRLGRTWTWMIVAQAAVAVATVPPAALMGRYWVSQAMADPGFPSDEYLSADLLLEREGNGFNGADLATAELTSALRATQSAVMERLAGDPAVAGVTFGVELPGYHPYDYVGLEASRQVRLPRVARIGTGYFSVFGVKLLAGRSFTTADVAQTADRPIIVNRAFAEEVFERGTVVGQRVRFPFRRNGTRVDAAQSPLREIVGVVEDFPAGRIGIDDPGDTRATLYEPIAPGEQQRITVFARTRVPLAVFVPRLRAIAVAVDPSLQLRDVQTVEHAYAVRRRELALAALGVVLVVGSVLLLSAAGMYAMMSFTVSQRRREIGVRSALGGSARHILMGVLGRTALQLGMGVMAGLVLVFAVDRWVVGGELLQRTGWLAIPATALFMVAIGLIAAAGPARYGLRIQPTEALRAE
jgi:predicted permease